MGLKASGLGLRPTGLGLRPGPAASLLIITSNCTYAKIAGDPLLIVHPVFEEAEAFRRTRLGAT